MSEKDAICDVEQNHYRWVSVKEIVAQGQNGIDSVTISKTDPMAPTVANLSILVSYS